MRFFALLFVLQQRLKRVLSSLSRQTEHQTILFPLSAQFLGTPHNVIGYTFDNQCAGLPWDQVEICTHFIYNQVKSLL
jgi:hypothetical protein